MPAIGVLLHLLGCSSDDSRQPSPTAAVGDERDAATALAVDSADAGPTPNPDALVDQIEAAGYMVRVGAVRSFFVEDCAALPSCYGANATSPYLVPWLPPAASEPEGALASDWRLRRDEAIVLVGDTPPAAAYYSFAPYLFSRYDAGQHEHVTVFASLADALNLANIHTQSGEVFGQRVAIVITADSQTHSDVVAALTAHAVPEASVNTLVLPSSVLQLGLEPEADKLQVLGRVALFDDREKGQAYLAQPPWRLLRITPANEREDFAPLDVPARMRRGTGTSESSLRAGLDALDAAIRVDLQDAHVAEIAILSARVISSRLDPKRCRDTLVNCYGEVSDTTYALGPVGPNGQPSELRLRDDPADYFIAYGVNHEAAGTATYSNVVVQNQAKQAGITDFTSRQMPGSAAQYLPNSGDADKLFVVKIARDCQRASYCIEVPTEFPGVALDENLRFIFRAYLKPGQSVSSAPSELLTERVLHVTP